MSTNAIVKSYTDARKELERIAFQRKQFFNKSRNEMATRNSSIYGSSLSPSSQTPTRRFSSTNISTPSLRSQTIQSSPTDFNPYASNLGPNSTNFSPHSYSSSMSPQVILTYVYIYIHIYT
jgi:hypothetical protein